MIEEYCFFCKDYASERNESLLSNCRVQLILLQRYAFLLKDARNYWKMFESEEDKKVYPRLPDVWGKKDTPLIIYYFKRNMTGISTEPATTLPSPSGTKRGISLTTLKASLSNRGSSLVFTAPEGETTVPEASKATVAVTVADAEGEPFTVSQEDADGIAAVESYENVHAKSQAKDKNGKVIKECNFTDVHLVKGKQTCYEGNFFDNTSSASFTVSNASLDDSGFSKHF